MKKGIIKMLSVVLLISAGIFCLTACGHTHEYKDEIRFKTLDVDSQNNVYGKVPNTQTVFSFINEVSISGNATFVVSTDIYGIQQVPTKTIPLEIGDNTFYITEVVGNNIRLFTVTIRRRPIYTVDFNANGGTAVQSQQVEEDSLAIEPVTTRAGYTFDSWDYDFANPIIENKTVKASWTANTNTAYKVEYYLQNLENDDYTIKETSNLTGTTDTKAIANIKTYEHFTFNQSKSTINGNINGNGSQTLKVYYTRNKYTLSNENTSYGEISNSGAYKFGTEEKQSTATEYLGCEFVGWFDGETLLSTDKSFIFNVCDKNVTAKFKVKAEMSNLNFTSNATTCTITGIKDKMMKNIVVPDYVTEISKNAFHNCSLLTSVTIGSGVTSIGSYAFYKCSSLQSLTIPNSVNSIGSLAFYGCTGLTEIKYNAINCAGLSSENYVFYHAGENRTGITVTIGKNVKKIPAYLFYPTSVDSSYLPKITAVIFEEGSICESIGDWAFSYCSSLTSVTIPNSVTSVGSYSFYNCSKLTSITIGNSVTSINNSMFCGCSSLTSIVVDSDNIKYHSKDNCLIETATNMLILGCKNSIIPDYVTSIGSYAFFGCSSLTSIEIPNSVTSIGVDAFYRCSSITSVVIGSGVTSIGEGAFEDCSSLTSVTIGSGVTSIGDYAFYYCSALKTINYNGTSTQWKSIEKGSYWKTYVPSTCKIVCTDKTIGINE